MLRKLLLLPLVGTALLVAACGSSQPTISDAWVRATPAGIEQTAAYMTIDGDDTLLGVSVPASVASATEIHKTMTSGPEMSMEMSSDAPMVGMHPQADLPVDGQVQLKPGGNHIMITGLKEQLAAGDQVPLTLKFKQAGEVKVTATVRQ